jgi:hypothetical protein
MRFVVPLTFVWLTVPLPVSAADWIYTVVSGDTIWHLSEKYLHHVGYWKRVQALNNVAQPRQMPPGLRLRIPLSWIRVNPVSAEVVGVNGEAALRRNGASSEQQATAGDRIELGDRLRTGPESSVTVRFADSSTVTLDGESSATFDHLSAYGDTGMVDSRVRLDSGRADARATPARGPGSRFEIRTPAAISAVRGTRYRTAVLDGEESTVTEVVGGRVAVRGARTTRLVQAGFGTRTRAGTPPSKPRRLLPAPELDPLPEPVDRINWPVTWSSLPKAEGYRVQIADNPAFEPLLWSRSVERTRAALPDLPDGSYHLRVRGVDALGLEGLDREQLLVLDARPQPPVPLQPENGAVLREEAATLVWSASAEATTYRLQMARDVEFTDLLIDVDGLENTRHSDPASAVPGIYHWRLSSIAADGEQGPWGPTRSLDVRPIPQAPPTEVRADEAGIVASWAEGAPGQSYRVQVAANPEFRDLHTDETTTAPQLRLSPTPGAVRFLRIAVVEPDGYQGPWGAVQRIDPPPDNSWLWTVIPAILGFLLL